MDNDLAHIELLANTLKAGPTEVRKKYAIAGFSKRRNAIGSQRLTELAKNYDIPVITLDHSHAGILEFCRWFHRSEIALLIHYSIPTLLPTWLSVFGPSRVSWYITKFELSCFEHLRHGISGIGAEYQIIRTKNVSWHRAPAALPLSYDFNYQQDRKEPIRMISINREEKLRNPEFLGAISEVLSKSSAVEFHWTGRTKDEEIVMAFRCKGVESHTKFLGWVNHVHTLPKYSLFVDTFGLSGMVAAAAFAAGMPIVFMRGSGSWLESFESQIIREMNVIDESISQKLCSVLADSKDDYIYKVNRIIRQIRDGTFSGFWQQQIGRVVLQFS